MGIGLTEGLIIAGIALVLFGGKKIPQFGRTLGESIKSFKEGLNTPVKTDNKEENTKKDS